MTNHSNQHTDYTTSIANMIEQIRTSDTSEIQSACHALLAELRTRPVAESIAIIWQIDDVQMQRPDLDAEQCREVLASIRRHHDANIGINWDVIDCAAHHCYPEPDNLIELRELAEAD